MPTHAMERICEHSAGSSLCWLRVTKVFLFRACLNTCLIYLTGVRNSEVGTGVGVGVSGPQPPPLNPPEN